MENWNELVKEISNMLDLKLYAQAVKMIQTEDEIPASAVRASEEFGHLAYCQAQALTKRHGETIYMGIKEHWCWASLVGFGHVDCSPEHPSFEEIAKNMGMQDLDAAKAFFAEFPKLPYGKYIGTVVGPAATADYEPDVVLISCDNNFQFRTILWAIKSQTGKLLSVDLDPIDSCVHTIVVPMLTGEYGVAIPDPGEQERALADRNEIILGVPFSRLQELYNGLKMIGGMHVGYRDMKMCMEFDYARPAFYNKVFELWGLETGKEWKR